VSYLDLSDKQVVGTTYKDLHQLVDRVAESGFFDAVSSVSAEPAAESADTELASDETDQPAEPETDPVETGLSTVTCQSYLLCVVRPLLTWLLTGDNDNYDWWLISYFCECFYWLKTFQYS